MRAASLLLIGIILSANSFAYSGDLRLHARETKTPKLGLNANGDVIRGEGNEFVVETDKEKNLLLAIKVNDKKLYLSYVETENHVPKLVLIEKPDANARWSKYEYPAPTFDNEQSGLGEDPISFRRRTVCESNPGLQ